MFMFTHFLEKMSVQERDKIEIERFKSVLLGAVVWSRIVAWIDVILGIPFLRPIVLVCCFTLNFFVHFCVLASRMGQNIKNKLAKRSFGICLYWIVAWRYWWYSVFSVFTRCTHPKLVWLTFERWGQSIRKKLPVGSIVSSRKVARLQLLMDTGISVLVLVNCPTLTYIDLSSPLALTERKTLKSGHRVWWDRLYYRLYYQAE